MQIINVLNGVFWGWLVAGILLGTGLFFTFRFGFLQILHFPKIFSCLRDTMKSEDNSVSGFAALCAALGGQVGTGSLVGVATALASGGPGAIFWMWITALLGMPITFAEAVLGQLFRVQNPDGTYRGGAAYYMERGLKNKALATLYSLCMIIAVGFFIAMIQSNSISAALTGVVDVPPVVAGVLVLLLTAAVIVGGIKRLADVSSYIVPFMALAYIAISLFIVITNITKFPAIFSLILRSAFSMKALGGGIAGYTMKEAFRYGVARGLFSNDAGNGAAAGMHATANVKHPVTQGFAGMLGTFFTTIIICSCTALCIMFTGALESGETGINLTQIAFGNALGVAGKWVVFSAMALFGFTTLLADVYYGEINLLFIFKGNFKSVWIYRIVLAILLVVAAIMPVDTLWSLIDFMAAFLVFFNVIALLGLHKYVVFAIKDYFAQKKKNKGTEPVWNWDKVKCSEED